MTTATFTLEDAGWCHIDYRTLRWVGPLGETAQRDVLQLQTARLKKTGEDVLVLTIAHLDEDEDPRGADTLAETMFAQECDLDRNSTLVLWHALSSLLRKWGIEPKPAEECHDPNCDQDPRKIHRDH